MCLQVRRALAVGYAGQASGRVRDVPDPRTIRYYTTLGLIDRPAAWWKRTALYSVRHALQLAAIKQLQAQGLSLAEVQARLVGQTDQALRELARLPPDFAFENPSEDRRDGRFWAKPPPEPPPPKAPLTLLGVPLAGGVTLLLKATRPLRENDIKALRKAAAPLLKRLRSRRLLAEDEGPSTSLEMPHDANAAPADRRGRPPSRRGRRRRVRRPRNRPRSAAA